MCRRVREREPEGRYRHSLCTARTAEKLACRYGVDRRAARVAGVLHDLARHWTADELRRYAREHGLPVAAHEDANPVLLHARVGADIARREFGVRDPQILAAIETHTVAQPGMSDLQKIMYMADTFEPSRRFAARETLESAAMRSLDEGMLACISSSLEYFRERGVPVAPQTMEVYAQLVHRNGTAS